MAGIRRQVLESSGRVRRKKIFQVFSYACLVLAGLFALTNFVFHLDKLYIRRVHIIGNQKVAGEKIFEIVKEVLSGKAYGIYPKNNLFIYPKEVIGSSIIRSLPWIASVNISGSPGSLLIDVEERVPKHLWCTEQKRSALDLECYYLDRNGFAFDRAPSFSDHIYFEFYGGNKRGGYMGRAVLPLDELNGVLDVKDSLAAKIGSSDIQLGQIYGAHIHNNGDYDLLVESLDGYRWTIKFDLEPGTLRKFEAVLGSPFFIKEFKDKGSRLEYIDLRFGKKVFYKFNPILN